MNHNWKEAPKDPLQDALMVPYQDLDCTIPATEPGHRVAAFKNALGMKLVQPTPANQPVIRKARGNWKDAIIGTLALFGFAAAIVWVAG